VPAGGSMKRGREKESKEEPKNDAHNVFRISLEKKMMLIFELIQKVSTIACSE
jgi:hypothetical protein